MFIYYKFLFNKEPVHVSVNKLIYPLDKFLYAELLRQRFFGFVFNIFKVFNTPLLKYLLQEGYANNPICSIEKNLYISLSFQTR